MTYNDLVVRLPILLLLMHNYFPFLIIYNYFVKLDYEA